MSLLLDIFHKNKPSIDAIASGSDGMFKSKNVAKSANEIDIEKKVIERDNRWESSQRHRPLLDALIRVFETNDAVIAALNELEPNIGVSDRTVISKWFDRGIPLNKIDIVQKLLRNHGDCPDFAEVSTANLEIAKFLIRVNRLRETKYGVASKIDGVWQYENILRAFQNTELTGSLEFRAATGIICCVPKKGLQIQAFNDAFLDMGGSEYRTHQFYWDCCEWFGPIMLWLVYQRCAGKFGKFQ